MSKTLKPQTLAEAAKAFNAAMRERGITVIEMPPGEPTDESATTEIKVTFLRKRPKARRRLTVCWGYEVEATLTISARDWSDILNGEHWDGYGDGYDYEGGRYQDFWTFNAHGDRSVVVEYGTARESCDGTGFIGTIKEVFVEEID